MTAPAAPLTRPAMTGEKDPRDVMQAEHDARLSEHPAFRAPAEMPGGEAARFAAAYLGFNPHDPSTWDADIVNRLVRIRSERGDQAFVQEVANLTTLPGAGIASPFNACGHREECRKLEARALAAEAALEKAVVFDLGNHQTIESRGDGRWAIKDAGCVLNADGVWEYEPNPSNRTDDFIARTRFDRDDAFRRAADIREQGE